MARTWPFRGCKIFPSSPEFPYRVPGNRKWTEKIWTDTNERCSKNGAKCQSQAPKLRVRSQPPGHQQGDLVDQANANAEAELQIHLHQTDVRLLRAIEDALARINHGTYGVCTVCKQPITKARLNAVPWTHLCRECKDESTVNAP